MEWIVYHRFIGVNHFYLYFVNIFSTKSDISWDLPDLPYTMYISWNYINFHTPKDYNQVRLLSF